MGVKIKNGILYAIEVFSDIPAYLMLIFLLFLLHHSDIDTFY